MEMHDPAHPGEIVREECLKPLGLTKTVPRHRDLSRLLSHMVGLHFVTPGQTTTQSRMQSQPRVHALCAVKCSSRPLRRFGVDGAAILGRPFRLREGRGVAARWGRCRSVRSRRGGGRG